METKTPPVTTRQPLLHVGSVTRDALEVLAQAEGTRWQDLARAVLKDYLHARKPESAGE